jgi:hypothetical protein
VRLRHLIAKEIRAHDALGVALLFERLELEVGEDLAIDRRLEQLVDADPRATDLLEAAR